MAASILKRKCAKIIFHSSDLHTLAHTMPKQYGATSHPCPIRSAISFSSWLSMLTLLCIVVVFSAIQAAPMSVKCKLHWSLTDIKYNSFLGCCAVCWRLGNHGLFFQSDMRKLILNDYGLWDWQIGQTIGCSRHELEQGDEWWKYIWKSDTDRDEAWLLVPPKDAWLGLCYWSRVHTKGLERAKERWEVGWAIMQEKSSNAWVHVCELVCFRVKYEAMILMRQPSSPLNFRLGFFFVKRVQMNQENDRIRPIVMRMITAHRPDYVQLCIQSHSNPVKPIPTHAKHIKQY